MASVGPVSGRLSFGLDLFNRKGVSIYKCYLLLLSNILTRSSLLFCDVQYHAYGFAMKEPDTN